MSFERFLKAYALNIGLLYSIGHILIFSTTNPIIFTFSLVSFSLCVLCVTLQFSKLPGSTFELLLSSEAPLLITGLTMLAQSMLSFSAGFILQGFIAIGFSTGNIIKVFELEREKRGVHFKFSNQFLSIILRPELLHSIANIALALFSSSTGFQFLPLLFVSLILSLLPNWKGRRINYAWPRLILTLYYLSLATAALLVANFVAAIANLMFVAGSGIITWRMNENFKTLTAPERGLSITKAI